MRTQNPFGWSRRLLDPLGTCLPALVAYDLSDRLSGEHQRANARWGRIVLGASKPRAIWVVGAGEERSVRLGSELAQAIAARRPDSTVVFTVECEDHVLFDELRRLPTLSVHHPPADHVASLNAFLRRLRPFGVIVVGTTPRPNLARLCTAIGHAVLVDPPTPVIDGFERIYPSHRAICPGRACALPVEFEALLALKPAPDAAKRQVAAGTASIRWCWHGDDAEALRRFAAVFRGHLGADPLLVSGQAARSIPPHADHVQPASMWLAQPNPHAALVTTDERSTAMRLAGTAIGVHFAAPHSGMLWSGLAGGATVSASGRVDIAAPNVASVVQLAEDEAEIARAWKMLRDDAGARVLARTASQRVYRQEHAAAELVANEMLKRIAQWR